jgi:hypothetical protein
MHRSSVEASVVIRVQPYENDGRPGEPCIVKLDAAEAIRDEYQNSVNVFKALPDRAARILGDAGYAKDSEGQEYGAMRLELAGACWHVPELSQVSANLLSAFKDLLLYESEQVLLGSAGSSGTDVRPFGNVNSVLAETFGPGGIVCSLRKGGQGLRRSDISLLWGNYTLKGKEGKFNPREGPPREGPPREGPPREGPPREGPPREGPPREGPREKSSTLFLEEVCKLSRIGFCTTGVGSPRMKLVLVSCERRTVRVLFIRISPAFMHPFLHVSTAEDTKVLPVFEPNELSAGKLSSAGNWDLYFDDAAGDVGRGRVLIGTVIPPSGRKDPPIVALKSRLFRLSSFVMKAGSQADKDAVVSGSFSLGNWSGGALGDGFDPTANPRKSVPSRQSQAPSKLSKYLTLETIACDQSGKEKLKLSMVLGVPSYCYTPGSHLCIDSSACKCQYLALALAVPVVLVSQIVLVVLVVLVVIVVLVVLVVLLVLVPLVVLVLLVVLTPSVD